MEFRILGSLEVADGGEPPAIGARPRTLLAFFLLHPNQVVAADRLIDALWGERPPATARAALQVHVAQLRKVLGAERIRTRAPGYAFRLEPGELDSSRFEALLAERRFADALELWRGPALVDVAYEPWAQAEIARLEEMRLSAREDRIEGELERGRHAENVAEIEAVVRAQPLRERPRAQLMLALYRCGRQADALAVYRETRRLLVDELGIEPGPELRELQARVLAQDPALAAPAGAPAAPAPAEPREERKLVTVLCCELSGVGRGSDPEALRDMVSRYQLRARAALEGHGGTVEAIVGEAVVALFGAPVGHEDDPLRAVAAALSIRDWIAELDEGVHARVGIAGGEALVRLDPRPAAGEAAAVGEVVGSASRLQAGAPQDAVVVGDEIYRATRAAVGYEPLGDATWLAVEARLAAAPPLAPFVGRDHELALLGQAHARAVREPCVQLVTIVGEPGIGKTRLVAELRAALGVEAWLQGRCLPYGDGITFWALGQIVKAHARILESDTPEQVRVKLAAAVEDATVPADRSWLEARLAPLVGAAGDHQTVEPEEAFTAWRTFVEGVAAQQPLVLVFEDLHWADSALLAFIEHLVDWAAAVPLFVVCTARPELHERAPGWGGGTRNATTIALAPLSAPETARLVAALLGAATLPDATRTALLERAGGNPLYAEEFVRMVRDVERPAEIVVPEGLHALIAARLDALSADRKALLHDAAVVGKVFWAGALAAMGRTSLESVLIGLHELGRRELVRRARRSSIAGDVEYSFWHALVRDVAYGQIPRAGRARRHVAAAKWIERIAGDRVTDHAEFLASHYRTALDLARGGGDQELLAAAVRYGTLAAQRAARLDPSQGERYYRSTLALLPDDDPRGARLLADAADAGTMSGAPFEQIVPELERAVEQLQAHGQTVAAANAMRQLSFLMWAHGEGGAARLAVAEEARRLLEPEPPGPELALAYARIAQEHLLAGRSPETIHWGENAVPLLERFGLADEALRTRTRIEMSRREMGDRAALGALRSIAAEAADPERGYGTFAICVALNNLGTIEQWFGAGPVAARKFLQRAADLARRRGLERPSMFYKGGLAEPLFDVGEWDAVLQLHDEIAAWERVRGRSAIGVLAAPSAARVLAARGALDAAGRLLDERLPRARALQDAEALIPFLVVAAMVASMSGRPSEVAPYVDELAQASPTSGVVVGYLPELVRACARAQQLAPLQPLLAALADVDEGRARFVDTVRAIDAEASGEPARAAELYARAEAGWEAHDCVVERAYALLGHARCRLELGDRPGATEPLDQARAIFARLQAAQAVADADALLTNQL